MKKLVYFVLGILVIGLFPALLPAKAIMVQYTTLASFDFLSADELSNFGNLTWAGGSFNASLVDLSVSDGILTINNSDTKDALLVYNTLFQGYVEVAFGSDGGTIAILTPANASEVQVGFEVVKDANGVSVYSVNGTDKTAVASLATSETSIIVSVLDGKFSVDLPDGTGVYQGSMDYGVMALEAKASSVATFDKVVLYGIMLAGTHSINLPIVTVTPGSKIAKIQYDVSKYNFKKAVLEVEFIPNSPAGYHRYVFVKANPAEDIPANWWDSVDTVQPIDFGIIPPNGGRRSVDITDILAENPTGEIVIGISTFDENGTGESWTINAKIVLDAEEVSSGTSTTEVPQESWKDKISNWISQIKGSNALLFIAAGVGAILIIVAVMSLAAGKGRGIAPMLAAFIVILVLLSIAAAILAWWHPEYLTALAFGLGAIALIVVFLMLSSGKSIPNPLK